MKLYSLARFYSAWKQQALPAEFKIGGRLSLHGAPILSGPPVALHLPVDPALKSSRHGDWVTLQLKLSDIQPGEVHFKIAKFSQLEISLRPNRQPKSADGEKLQGLAQKWSEFLKTVRDHFTHEGLTEVQTPSLVCNPGMEPELEPFQLQLKSGSKTKKLFLPTSPELHIKQLIVKGLTDVFEIKNVFRNEEFTDVHEPEFTMIEWYRGFANLEMIKADLAGLLTKLKVHSGAVKEYAVADFFKQHFDFILTPKTSRDELFNLAESLHLKPGREFDFNDIFHLIWVDKIEPQLPTGAFILKHYPPSQAALAKLTSDGWADRFELYWNRIEIANAFHELNDVSEQRRRFIHDQKKRIEYGRTPLEIDENFMAALEEGLPPSAGIALGLDRLFMASIGETQIAKTRLFSVSHQFENNQI